MNSQKGRFNYVASCDFPSFRGCSEVVATKDHFQRIRGLVRVGAVGASAPKVFESEGASNQGFLKKYLGIIVLRNGNVAEF